MCDVALLSTRMSPRQYSKYTQNGPFGSVTLRSHPMGRFRPTSFGSSRPDRKTPPSTQRRTSRFSSLHVCFGPAYHYEPGASLSLIVFRFHRECKHVAAFPSRNHCAERAALPQGRTCTSCTSSSCALWSRGQQRPKSRANTSIQTSSLDSWNCLTRRIRESEIT